MKLKLINAIESSGGLTLVEEEKEDDEDEIEVPKSEFIDDEEGEVKVDDNVITSLSLKDINIAMPKDKSSPFDNKWIQIDDEVLPALTFNDYDILAFDYQDNHFEITEVTYED